MPFSVEELKERQRFLGASEAAASIGMSPWYTPLQLYMSKLGLGEPVETTIPMMVGTALEPVVLELFERQTGLSIHSAQQKFVDSTTPWRRATVDAIASDGAVIEAKTSGDFRGWGEGEDEIPLPYMYNIHHTFACNPDWQMAYFPVLVGGRTFKLYKITRDNNLVDLIRSAESAFWNCVQNKTPPEVKSVDDLKILFPRDTGKSMRASDEIEERVRTLANTKAKIKTLETVESMLAFEIKKYMADASTLIGNNAERLATYNTSEVSRFDTKAFKAAHVALANQFTTKVPQRTLLLKIQGDDE